MLDKIKDALTCYRKDKPYLEGANVMVGFTKVELETLEAMLSAAPPVTGGAQYDLSKCPRCLGEADNGHDRCIPPTPYLCTKCSPPSGADKEGV